MWRKTGWNNTWKHGTREPSGTIGSDSNLMLCKLHVYRYFFIWFLVRSKQEFFFLPDFWYDPNEKKKNLAYFWYVPKKFIVYFLLYLILVKIIYGRGKINKFLSKIKMCILISQDNKYNFT